MGLPDKECASAAQSTTKAQVLHSLFLSLQSKMRFAMAAVSVVGIFMILRACAVAKNPQVHSSSSSSSSNNVAQVVADSYKLVLQWGNSFCNTVKDGRPRRCRRPVEQQFTIHGLWPYDQHDKIFPSCTHGSPLSFKQVFGIAGLRENWPNLVAGKHGFQFWRKQWEKHGRCLGLPATDYFGKAVSLKQQIDTLLARPLIELFEAKGLSPSHHIKHPPQRFAMEIYNNVSVVTRLNCNWNENGEAQLYEVLFCFTKQWVLTHCREHGNKPYARRRTPIFKVSNCYSNGSKIHFPPATRRPPPPASPPPSPLPLKGKVPSSSSIDKPEPLVTYLEKLLEGLITPSSSKDRTSSIQSTNNLSPALTSLGISIIVLLILKNLRKIRVE